MSNSRLVLKAHLMDSGMMARAMRRLAHEITEKNKGAQGLVIVGILSRGEHMARRLCEEIYNIEGVRVPVGSIDVTYYRDDLTHVAVSPILGGTDIPFDINRKNVILVDDVIYTGRTVRAAIDALFRKGRPDKVQLAVMIDRGLRELPFKPDFVGKNIPTSHSEKVEVHFAERDGEDSVDIYQIEKEEDNESDNQR